jgi:mRNA interferase RelE/StbE
VVTDHGAPSKVIVSYNDMLDLLDILDELQDPGAIQAVQEGREAYKKGEALIPVSHLSSSPRPLGEPKIKPPILAHHFLAQYRVRVGDYRILYDVDDKKKTVIVLDLRKRNEKTYR